MKISVSSIAFKNLEELLNFFDSHRKMYLELGVNLSKRDISKIREKDIKISSLHVPSPKEPLLPNFASFDSAALEKSLTILMKSVEVANELDVDTLVIHPGYALDGLLPTDSKERDALLAEWAEKEKDFIIHESFSVTEASYVKSDVYRKYLENLAFNLSKLRIFLEKHLALENLNPRLFYIPQTPEDVVYLVEKTDFDICLDTGHLWISSQVNDFDFYEGLESILRTHKVRVVHLNNNSSNSSKGQFKDDHDHLLSGEIDMHKVLRILDGYDIEVLTVEVKRDPTEDVTFLLNHFS